MNATLDMGRGPRKISGKLIATWIGIALGLMTLSQAITGWVARQVVKPKQLDEVTDQIKEVKDKQEASSALTARLSLRVDTLNDKMADITSLAEVLVIDVCLRNMSNPYAMQRLDCDEFVK